MSATAIPRLTADEYLALDRASEWKSEFHDGEMFPMEAVSFNHAAIATNVAAVLRPRLRTVGCSILTGPLRVRVSASWYLYPDFQIICGKAQLTDENSDTVSNPKVTLEILSPSTAGYDRGAKFEFYRRLSSVAEYVVIAQSKPMAEVFTKQTEHSWELVVYDSPESLVQLKSVSVSFPLGDLYEGVEFAEGADSE